MRDINRYSSVYEISYYILSDLALIRSFIFHHIMIWYVVSGDYIDNLVWAWWGLEAARMIVVCSLLRYHKGGGSTLERYRKLYGSMPP